MKKGQLAGYCGNTGASTGPHCHYEVLNQKPENWLQYPAKKWTKEQILKIYLDPMPFVTKTLPMSWDRYGYKFLSIIAGGGYHLGVDLNFGAPWDDNKRPIYFTTDGVIRYVGDAKTDGGAGNNLWWSQEEPNTSPMPMEYLAFESEKSGQFALVQAGKKRIIAPERSGQAALYCQLNKVEGKKLNLKEWDAIPTGQAF